MVDEFEFGKLYYNPEYEGIYFLYLGTTGGYNEYCQLDKGVWEKGVLNHESLCLYVHLEEQ